MCVCCRSDSIHTTTYEGTDYREVLRGHEALSHPFAITVFESHVYWTDWRSNSLVRANKWNGSDVTVLQRTLTQPFDLKVSAVLLYIDSLACTALKHFSLCLLQ